MEKRSRLRQMASTGANPGLVQSRFPGPSQGPEAGLQTLKQLIKKGNLDQRLVRGRIVLLISPNVDLGLDQDQNLFLGLILRVH